MQFPKPGQTFQGKYELVQVLGRGGFAAVYKAIDVDVGRSVAIKFLVPGEDGYDPSLVARFLREARVVAQLKDPHNITMFDFGRSDDGLLYMVFEYVAGADLAHVLEDHGPVDPHTAIRVVRQLLFALREAHAAGVLHRDIKPANILVHEYMGDPWRVKLLDFGIAKPGVGKSADPVATLTKTGGIIGTPRYMSPEQLCGEELDATTDIYSLGLVAYELLTGSPAIDGRDTRDNLRLQLSEQPIVIPPSSAVPSMLRTFVERLMAREASDRFQSAAQALEVLDAVERDALSGPQPPMPGPPGPVTTAPAHRVPTATRSRPLEAPPRPWTVRLRELPTPALVGIGALVGGIVVIPIMLTADRTQPPPPRPPSMRVSNDLVRGMAQPDTPRPATIAAPIVTPPATPTTGCGQPAKPGERSDVETFGFEPQRWVTYIPKQYREDRKHPLVLLFHDRTRTASSVMRDMRFSALADQHGFIVVALEGGNYTAPWRPAEDIDDVRRVIARTRETVCLDTSRLYAVGHNVGGWAVEQLSCLMPFSAIATTAYRGDGGPPCARDTPVPHIHIVGRDNQYMPIKGGSTCEGGSTVPLAAKEDAWFQMNGCTGARRSYAKLATGACTTKKCADAAFVSCVAEGGRDWPDNSGRDFQLDGCKIEAGKFPYSATIWDFFVREGRRLEVEDEDAPDAPNGP